MRAPAVEFSQQIADRICEEVAEGKSIREVGRADGMPAEKTIRRWSIAKPEFKEQLEDARKFGWESLADSLLEIADDGRNDWMERNGKDGSPGYVLNGEHVQRSRLRVDTIKWMLTKMLPKIYGDKVTTEVSGFFNSTSSSMLLSCPSQGPTIGTPAPMPYLARKAFRAAVFVPGSKFTTSRNPPTGIVVVVEKEKSTASSRRQRFVGYVGSNIVTPLPEILCSSIYSLLLSSPVTRSGG